MKHLYSSRIWVDDRRWIKGRVTCSGGKIVAIEEQSVKSSPGEHFDYGDICLIPGLVDTHVHINEPGRTEWEGFASATHAAAAGGITTLADMPLNCIPVTTSLAALQEKIVSLSDKLTVDCAFHGGIVPGNVREIRPMVEAGVRTFKCFMIDSGIPEFAWISEDQLLPAMQELARHGATLLAHAEIEHSALHGCDRDLESHPESYRAFLKSRPASMENLAIGILIRLAKQTGCAVHIVHLSSAEALNDIRAAKAQGVPITCETCPHYLLLDAESIPDGDGRFKCMPPIRTQSNREQLWQGLLDGTIDFVVSDHSPCTPKLKRLGENNLRDAWGGISSLQFGLSLLWPEACRRGLSLETILPWLTSRPALLIKQHQRKGRIAVGWDADIVAFDERATGHIDRTHIFHRHKETPYEGWQSRGMIHATWLRGERVYHQGSFAPKVYGEKLL